MGTDSLLVPNIIPFPLVLSNGLSDWDGRPPDCPGGRPDFSTDEGVGVRMLPAPLDGYPLYYYES